MKVKKTTLLLLAGIVWMFAGFNILKIGISAYTPYLTPIHIVISMLIFFIFWGMIFSKLVTKHTERILTYEQEHQFFLNFFDMKSFCIMAIMMIAGISLRAFELWPQSWIAVFYSGLGAALFLAGVYFTYHYGKTWLSKEER